MLSGSASDGRVLLANAIPRALAHYERELIETLASVDIEAERASWARPVEGLSGLTGKLAMQRNAAQNILDASRTRLPLIQLWPSHGLYDARLWASSRYPRYVMLHDPTPLRRQVGFSSFAARWAAEASPKRRPMILVHSEPALRIAKELLPRHSIELVPHPILDEQSPGTKTIDPSVVVAGQYKPARDIELLAGLGPLLQELGWRTRIVGRGWPAIPGWGVENRFVGEAELDRLLSESWAFLLPYRTYFQSGMAVRALESGTVAVGEAAPFLTELFGGHQSWLVPTGSSADAYVDALQRVRESPPSMQTHFVDYRQRARIAWRELLSNFSTV